jgi:tripartite-type tricarboxylate transporter receptor subunit TctC
MDRRGFIGAGVAAATTIGTAAAFGIAVPARAQERYPSRPVKLVVPFPPGGPTDVFARRYAERASEVLGQQMIVENRAGAGGTIGASFVAKAPPDGYTLLFGTSSTQVTGPLMLASPPYDPIKDFRLLIVGVVPMILTVMPTLKVDSAKELIELIRANPGKYTYSSAGPGSINHLGIELLKLRAGGLNALHVPYKGTNPAQVALMAGEVDFMLDTFGTSLQLNQAGKLKILATMGEKRSTVAPNVPTTLELGIPDSTCVTVNVVAFPAATPAPVADALASATRRIMGDPAMVDTLGKMGIEPVADADAQRSASFFSNEIARWGPIVKASGATI